MGGEGRGLQAEPVHAGDPHRPAVGVEDLVALGAEVAGGGLRRRALGERDIGDRDGRRRAVIAAVEKRRPHEGRQIEHVDHGIMIEVTLAP